MACHIVSSNRVVYLGDCRGLQISIKFLVSCPPARFKGKVGGREVEVEFASWGKELTDIYLQITKCVGYKIVDNGFHDACQFSAIFEI